MLIKPLMFVTIPSLILGTMIACSSSSWLIIWMGLEINLMSFIPLLINKLSQSNSENSIKYFLIQAMASILIISMVSVNSMEINYTISNHSINIIMMSLALKAGVAPVHFWFPQIIEGLNWLQTSVILTWQKIAPMIIISYNFTNLMPLLVISSALLGAILGINQVSFKKIMAFSSIMNAAWLIMASFLSMNMWWIYFITYSVIIISIIFSWNKIMSNNNINSNIMLEMNLIFCMLIFLNILSLAGLPPFAGFFIKIMVIETMMSHSMMWITIIMLISSTVAFYYYMRMMYSMLFFNSKKTSLFLLSFNYKKSFIKPMIVISSLLNLGAVSVYLII